MNEQLLGSQIPFIQVREVAAISQDLEITGIERNDNEVTLTWRSRESDQFSVFFSLDLVNWDGEIEDNIMADPVNSTTRVFDLGLFGLQNEAKVFFRVER